MLEEVRGFMDRGMLMMMSKAHQAAEEFKEEKGASDIVAIIVIIAIILVIAVIFRDSLKKVVEAVFTNLSDFVDNNKG